MEEKNENNQENVQPDKVVSPIEEKKEQTKQGDVEENRMVTYLSYLGILFLVPLVLKRESPFAQFHSKQGLVLTIGWVLGGPLYAFFGLGILVHLAVLIFSVMGLLQVNSGQMKDLPVVGNLAKKFNI